MNTADVSATQKYLVCVNVQSVIVRSVTKKEMAKLCAKGKAAAKRKFKVYPSAYANMYASGVCSGKIVPGGRKKKADGGSVNATSQSRKKNSSYSQGGIAKGCGGVKRRKKTKKY